MDKYNSVSQLNSERSLQLERAHSLACQFWETCEELWPWLQETQAKFTQLPSPAIEYDTLRQQQEELRVRTLRRTQDINYIKNCWSKLILLGTFSASLLILPFKMTALTIKVVSVLRPVYFMPKVLLIKISFL